MLEDDLVYFSTVASAGSLARAAERLGVSQPALTKSVQRLERRLGVKLLLRSSRGIELTDAGAAFLVRSRAISRELEVALQEARDVAGGHAGLLRIGATPAAANFALGSLLPRLIKERPAARIYFVSGFSDALLDSVANGDVELALLPLPERMDPSLDMLHLLEDDYRVVVNDQHPLASLQSVSMGDLAGCQWAGSSKHEFARVQLERAFALEAIALPNLVLEANNLPALLLAVSRMPLVSMVNSHAVSPENLPANVVMLPIRSEHIRCPIGMVWRRGYMSSIALRAKELLQAAARA
ncbi:LysR family transcriptional regulator [Pseudomonas sp. YuFO20]|uniref:LysR family transcriptional regulator n=1 Tax=Pseudomonas sp. YuFO20 TaxID=3095362 RepID=UPI002B24B2AE|nr:LysR family transcriptional regulator [Pseudomonas sp. YuFO20]MEB2519680.1 LysR family transcriptional regulator [Pseudomonas sp. YuFO20]